MQYRNILGGRRVLILEDDYLIVAELVESLQSMGADVIGPCATLEQARRHLQSGRPIDVAILDVNLSGRPVFPFADELRSRGIPYVFATAYDATMIPSAHRDIERFGKPYDVGRIARALLEPTAALA
ncbi:response regulator [Devosia albogilva]|uniref:Response regulator n=1 Tax=Devosia albogilva TaxID=429726 RepID=A0ABW5QP78_9HYPH